MQIQIRDSSGELVPRRVLFRFESRPTATCSGKICKIEKAFVRKKSQSSVWLQEESFEKEFIDGNLLEDGNVGWHRVMGVSSAARLSCSVSDFSSCRAGRRLIATRGCTYLHSS